MERVGLLTVERTSWLKRPEVQMLIILPDFPTPRGWKERGWIRRTETVLVVRPDGSQVEASAEINMTHRNMRGPAPIEERWRITMWLTDRTTKEVPDGSKILVSREIRDAILPDNVA
jgi:hypothetical protein